MIPTIQTSDITWFDAFCGCGGSTQGIKRRGTDRVVIAANHNPIAVEYHNRNHPEVLHDCADLRGADPRRYPRTRCLWASPTCTHHTNANGQKKWDGQIDMFDPARLDLAAERSRMTMFTVPELAEYHHYEVIIVENVVEVVKWRLFTAWLQAMISLGYSYRICYLNSMFFGAPQSRDRVYIVFWRKEIPAPNLDFCPPAWCDKCERQVNAIQSWKKGVPWGKYGDKGQYWYRCPHCAAIVRPPSTPAFVAIDWSDPGIRIGDRETHGRKPLRPATLERVRKGLERFGNHVLVLELLYGGSNRTQLVTEPLSTQTTRQSKALIGLPFTIAPNYDRARLAGVVDEPLATLATWQTQALAVPFLTSVNYFAPASTAADDPMPTQTTASKQALTLPPGAIIVMRRLGEADSLDEPLTTITAGGRHHGILRLPFVVNNRGNDGYSRGAGVDDSLPAITTSPGLTLVQPGAPFILGYVNGKGPAHGPDEPLLTIHAGAKGHAVVMPPAWLSIYNGNSVDAPIDQGMPVITSVARHALVNAADVQQIAVEDCYFRMLKVPEILVGMDLGADYQVPDSDRLAVMLAGNAVTPCTADWLSAHATENLQ